MLPEIKNPEDWYTVDLMLKNMVRSMPEFRHDYSKLVNTIQTKINELSKIDIEIRRKSSARPWGCSGAARARGLHRAA